MEHAESNPAFAQRLSYIVSAMVSILVSEVAILLVFQVIPSSAGVWFRAFTYVGELVEISPFGFLLPIILSACLLFVSRRATTAGRRIRVFQTRNLWLAVALFALISTLVFTLTQYAYDSVELPNSWAIWIVPVGAVIGVAYGVVDGRRSTVLEGLADCYIVAALGLAIGDVIRTLAKLVVAPEIVWGGGGLHDLVLWFGIYVGLGYAVFRLVCSKTTGIFSKALVRKQD
jgi:hypothetical protein